MMLFFVINDLPFLLSHRLPVLLALRDMGLQVAVVAPAHGQSEAQLREAGIAFISWEIDRSSLSLRGELRSVAQLWRIYRRYRPALVHHVTPKPVIYGGIAARLAGVPRRVNAISGLGMVFSALGNEGSFRQRLTVVAHGLAHRGTGTRVIFQNPDDRRALVDRGCVPLQRCRMIPGSGVDPQRWAPAVALERQSRVTVACRMLYDKGVADTVSAADHLRRLGIPLDLQLAGGCDPASPRAISEQTLRGWHDAGQAQWLGRVEDMVGQWRASRIACMPSYYGEGIPKALIEAASCGLPIVTCDVPGCREIVRHGDNGLLVPPRDPDALAAALRTLLVDYDLCVRMGQRGRERVIAEFSLDRVVQMHMDIYRELLGPLWPEAAR